MTKKSDKERQASKDEISLWRYVTRHDVVYVEEEPEEEPVFEAIMQAEQVKPAREKQAVEISQKRPQSRMPMLEKGDMTFLDKRNAERFRKGKLSIQVTVDLHGLNQEAAFDVLCEAMAYAYDKGWRTMLVITGKGYTGDGILRQRLPLWLNHERIRPFILAFAQAKAKDGGDGACYVMIKRRR